MTGLILGILLGLAGFILLGLLMLAAFIWGRRQSKAEHKGGAAVSDPKSRIPTTVTTIPRGGIAQTKFTVSSPGRGDTKKTD